MIVRLRRLLPLVIAFATLIGLGWLASSMLFVGHGTGDRPAPAGLQDRFESFGSYPRMARAFELIEKGRLDEAATWLESVIKDDPSDVAALEQLAELRLRQDRPAPAVDAAQRASELRPAAPELQWLLARAQAAAGDFEAALNAVDRALGQGLWTTGLKNPERQRAEAARVGYLLELGKADAARRALAALPEPTADDMLRLGDLFYAKGELGPARDAFAAARQRAGPPTGTPAADGDWAKATRRLAEIALKAGDKDAAMAAYEDLVERFPDDAAALRTLSNLAEEAGRPSQAADWLARAIAAGNGDNIAERQRLARLYLEAGEPAAAARVLLAVPDAELDARGEALKARVLLELGRPGEAAARFEALAKRLDGRDRVEALRSAAEARRREGDLSAELALRREIAEATGKPSDRQALLDRLIAEKRWNEAADRLSGQVAAGDQGALERMLTVLLAADRAGEGIKLLVSQGHLVEAAELAASVRRWPQAADLFGQAYRATGGSDPDLLARAVYAAGQGGGRAARIDVLRAAFPYRGLPPRRARDFGMQLVQALEEAGRSGEAERLLMQLAERSGDPALALDVATRLAGRGDCRGALVWADRAEAAKAPPPRLFALSGFCANRLGQTARARQDLQRAIDRADAIGTAPEPAWLDTLGFLEAAEGRTAVAVGLWQRSLAMRFDASVALATAVALRRLDRPAEADRLLARIDPADLTTQERARYFTQRADAAAAAGDRATARDLLRRAIALDPSADRWFRLGSLAAEAGDTTAALAGYEKAAALDPGNADIQAAMGYALVDLGRDEPAETHFARALALRPDGLDSVYEDSGYVNKRLARNDVAVSRFKTAIDRETGVGPDAAEKRFRLRREVERLENRWTATANLTVNTLEAAAGAPSPVRDTSNGTGGVELAWQPPVIGNRNGRTVQIFSRMFWNAEDGSLVPVQNSLQAGIGARWKPLTDYNLVLSFERLFAIGRFAYDDWLARASISFGQNLDWQPVRSSWPTGSLYLDAARVLGEGATFLTAIGQYGHAWKQPLGVDLPAQADAVAAYGLATASHSRDGDVSNSRVEIGLGLGYLLWFNESKYEAYRSSADIGLEARYQFQNNAQDGLVLQLRALLRL